MACYNLQNILKAPIISFEFQNTLMGFDFLVHLIMRTLSFWHVLIIKLINIKIAFLLDCKSNSCFDVCTRGLCGGEKNVFLVPWWCETFPATHTSWDLAAALYFQDWFFAHHCIKLSTVTTLLWQSKGGASKVWNYLIGVCICR